MAAKKTTASYPLIGLATASLFLMAFAFTMYKLERAGATPYKEQLANGYATLDDSYLDPPADAHPLDALIARRDARRRAAETQAEAAQQAARQQRTRFEFYSVLPEFEVAVPRDAEELGRQAARAARDAYRQATTAAQTGAAAIAERGAQIVTVPTAANRGGGGGGQWLQAGAFAARADASRRRAEIIMLGLSAQLESVDRASGQLHRVKLGPFADTDDRDSARGRLRRAGIDSIVKSH